MASSFHLAVSLFKSLGFEFEPCLYFILNSVEMGKPRLLGESNYTILNESVLENTCTSTFGHSECSFPSLPFPSCFHLALCLATHSPALCLRVIIGAFSDHFCAVYYAEYRNYHIWSSTVEKIVTQE